MPDALEQQTPANPQGSPNPSETPSLLNKTDGVTLKEPVKDGVSLLNDPKPELKTEPKAENKKAEPPGAPEKYADFKAPEGFEIDPKALEEATPLFKELGLSQEKAQKVVDFYAKLNQQAAEAPVQLWKDTQEAWVDEIKSDPEIGGKLDLVRQTVSKAIDGLGPELAVEFRKAMDFTGAGNNPAFVKGFYAMAKQLTEGSFVRGGGPSSEGQGNQGRPQNAAKALYPNLA